MDEMDAWTSFMTTGSVVDYLRYKSIQNSKDTGADTFPEDENEDLYGRSDHQRTEYR